MQYLRSNLINKELIYSVYNSQGDLALYTRDRVWAEHIAQAFKRNPQTTVVIVAEKPQSGSGNARR